MMATSGQLLTNKVNPDGWILYLEFNWVLASQNIESNSSTINWELIFRIQGQSSGSYVYIGPTKAIVNDVGSIKSRAKTYNNKTVLSGTRTINHDSLGDATLSVSVSSALFTGSINSEGSKSWELDNIPRASVPTFNPTSAVVGDVVTISTNRVVSSFTHELSWSYSGYSEIISSNVSESTSWTVPNKLIELINSSSAAEVEIICKTFNQNEENQIIEIGSKTIKYEISIPEEIKPNITSHILTDTNIDSWNKFSQYIQGKSVLKVSTIAVPGEEAILKNIVTTFENKNHSGSEVEIPLNLSGSKLLNTKATDSRDRFDEETKLFVVTPYISPTINKFKVYRVDDEGIEHDKGTKIKCEINFEITSIDNLNDNDYKIEMSRDGQTWTTIETGSAYTFNDNWLSEELFDVSFVYQVKLTIKDFYGENHKIVSIPVGYTTMNFRSNGRGIGIGKISEKNALEIEMPVEFNDQVSGIEWGMISGDINDSESLTSKILNQTYPINSLYTTCINSDPSTLLGGTWELVDKKFKLQYKEIVYTQTNANSTLEVVFNKDIIDISFRITLKVELSDSAVRLVDVDLEDLGFTGEMAKSYYGLIGATDGGNFLIQGDLLKTGALNSIDTFDGSGGKSNVLRINAIITPAIATNKIDSFCDEFIWKKAA